jgi:aquaglyceroporin related protein
MSSSDTAYSPDNSPKRKDWARLNKHENGGYGIGPGVRDPNDSIQNSDAKYEQHQEKVAQTVGAGPSTKTTSDTPQYGHFEHREYARSPVLSPPPPTQAQPLTHEHLNEHLNQLHHAPTASTNNTYLSHRTKKEIEHENTLSSIRTKIGLERESPIIDDHHVHQHLTWSSVRTVLREPFAEFFGVFVMVLFGDGSVAQVLLSAGEKSAPGMNAFGSYQSINWCWGLGVMLGIYVAGDSGAFLNPAITFSFCLFRKLPWRRFPIYFLAQFLGGFCAAGVVYANYVNAINEYEGHEIRTVPPSSTATAGIFCTYPQAFLTKASMFFSEFIASTILIFVIFALKDDSNPGAMGKSGAGPFFPLALLFLIFGLGAGFGYVFPMSHPSPTSLLLHSLPFVFIVTH